MDFYQQPDKMEQHTHPEHPMESLLYFVMYLLKLIILYLCFILCLLTLINVYLSFFYACPRVGLSILIKNNVNSNLVTKIFHAVFIIIVTVNNFYFQLLVYCLDTSLLTGIRRKFVLVVVSISLCYK
jgi:hypothetical protein